ncbi:insulin-like growth factor-binding protein 1 isoform X2 [Embiotoca jacksoni]|uniref:insulin-like growth factor-binding protein 1 isoform X2 n=1 Tax=Embiotoca jacksoni TaxID=100190 RepID=UPI003703B00B
MRNPMDAPSNDLTADCKQVLREPGCGCCMACALEEGVSCGVHTAHCGEGLHCTPRPGEVRPLHALTRGQGVCTEDLNQGRLNVSWFSLSHVFIVNISHLQHFQILKFQLYKTFKTAFILCITFNIEVFSKISAEEADVVTDHSSLHYLLGLNLPLDQQDTAEGQERIKAKVNAIRNKLVQRGPCHIELDAAMDMIASSQQKLGDKLTTFYLPNCDKHGFYKAKQCESSLVGPPARCWCVSSWNGKKLPGSSDLLSDSECHQEVTH